MTLAPERHSFQTDDGRLRPIAEKVLANQRLDFNDGVALYGSGDILAVGWLAPAAFAGASVAGSWDGVASRVAAGDLEPVHAVVGTALHADAIAEVSRAALVHGFGWLMVYGGSAVCGLAVVSYLIFSGGKFRK